MKEGVKEGRKVPEERRKEAVLFFFGNSVDTVNWFPFSKKEAKSLMLPWIVYITLLLQGFMLKYLTVRTEERTIWKCAMDTLENSKK